MLIYRQSTGLLTGPDGKRMGMGYSGSGAGKNDPAAQDVPGIGPIPRGLWSIGAPYDSARTGPFTIPLYKLDDAKPGDDVDQANGRSAFRIHGDSLMAPGTASRGCIVLPRIVRNHIVALGAKQLQVIA